MTKYITIRIPIPTLNWFTKKEEEEFSDTYSDLSNRIAEIQARISVAKKSLECSARSNKDTSSQTKLAVDTDPKTERPRSDDRDRKAAEMNDLKAKLLGKKN
jgi:hypothetical protein